MSLKYEPSSEPLHISAKKYLGGLFVVKPVAARVPLASIQPPDPSSLGIMN